MCGNQFHSVAWTLWPHNVSRIDLSKLVVNKLRCVDDSQIAAASQGMHAIMISRPGQAQTGHPGAQRAFAKSTASAHVVSLTSCEHQRFSRCDEACLVFIECISKSFSAAQPIFSSRGKDCDMTRLHRVSPQIQARGCVGTSCWLFRSTGRLFSMLAST